ncbi:MAG: hypothetical protein ACLQVA_13795 [Candidatus Brocadiia bacterium]
MDQTASSPRYPLRVRIGLALVLALLLLSQLVLIINLAQTLPSAMATESMARYEKRYVEARKVLPRVGVIGYLGEPPGSGGVTQGLYQRRYHTAEYILAPLVIADSLEPDLILGNFFFPHAMEKAISEHHLIVLYDFRNGVFILRKAGS